MTAMELYNDIRRNNVRDYGEKVDNYIKIIINQYSDRTHFIYEIIQNAEDAGATRIHFYLYNDRLEIIHDGRPFSDGDVRGICSIAEGTKNGDGTQIGHFGIGFKAVYGYTNTPSIYSGDKCFEIRGYINPYEIQKRSSLKASETCFVLPFDGDNVTKELAFLEIRDALSNKLNANSIVMLKNIQQVGITISDQVGELTIARKSYPIGNSGCVFGLTLATCRNDEEEYRNYLLFTDNEQEASTLVFLLDDREKLKAIANSRIYAFFPTAKESHQGFLIHAPFDTTPARDNFKEGEGFGRHNIKLIKHICKLIEVSFCWLRDSGYLTIYALGKLFPIYRYEQSDILYEIYLNSIRMIENGAELLPDNDGLKFHSINQICIPESMAITSVFSDDDLRKIFHKENLCWLSKEIATDSLRDFRYFLNANFKIVNLKWGDLIGRMDSSFLGSKDIEWYARMFESICDFCGTSHARQSNYIDASMIPLIRLRNGTNIAAAGNQARVYLNNPASADYKIDDRFLDNQVIYDFYSGVLEIDNYDIVKEVRQSVLPKYAKREPIFVTNNPSLENDKDLKKIQEAMSKDSAIVNEVSNCYLLTDSTSWYLPKELYIRSIDTYCGYGLIKNKSSLKFLSDDYSYNFPDEFFERIGCPKGLALQEVTHSKYLVAARKYLAPDQCNDISIVISKKYLQTRSAFFVNYEGFPEVFQDMSPDRSLQIMRFLNANALSIDIKGDIDGADNKKFFGNVETRNFYTYLGLEICFEKWIYDKDGKGPHRPVDIDQERLLSTYAPLKGILRKLPLRDNTSKIKNLISTTSLSDRQIEELASHIVASPDELYEMMKAKEKRDAREAAKKHVEEPNIGKTIENQNVKQQEPKAPPTESEVPPISETGIEIRAVHLEEEFNKSMDSAFSVKHGFSFALKACTEEEKEFLRQEYRGRCQICHTSILKADGTQYFEAIQIIKRSGLAEDQQGTLKLGWNTLCLCPNCAAKYNYGSKDLSGMCQQILQAKIVEESDEPIGIDIVISGSKQTIDYSPRHLMALQKALELSK